jgi:hypothetical protein
MVVGEAKRVLLYRERQEAEGKGQKARVLLSLPVCILATDKELSAAGFANVNLFRCPFGKSGAIAYVLDIIVKSCIRHFTQRCYNNTPKSCLGNCL